MIDSDLTPLRDRCPRLHEEINAAFHDLAMRCGLEVLAALAEAINSCTPRRWRKRRKYIENVTSRNDELLSRDSHPPDHYWELCEYDIEAEDRKAVPKHLLKLGTYIPPLKTHHLRFEAWVPADLATPRWALPPESLGRPYSVDELAFSFAVLHDADGGFESIVPAWHQWMDGVYGNCYASVRVPGLSSTATDLWVAELKPLLARVHQELSTAERVHDDEETRSKDPKSDGSPEIPRWDDERMQLHYRGVCVCETTKRATNINPVLKAFQRAGWPTRLPDPLEPHDPGKVHETVRSLNNKQAVLNFSAARGGTVFTWQPAPARGL